MEKRSLAHAALSVVVGVCALAGAACSSSGTNGVMGVAGSGGAGGSSGSSAGSGGSSGASGAAASGGTDASGAVSPSSSGNVGGSGNASASGSPSVSGSVADAASPAASGGSGDAEGGTTSASDASSPSDGGGGIGVDQVPWRALHVTASPAQYVHNGLPQGNVAGLDTRAAKMAGKLIVDLGVASGGYQSFLGKRGFHVIGANQVYNCPSIDDWSKGRDYDGNCRLNTLDGMPHGDQSTVPPAQSLMSQVLNDIDQLSQMYPAEDWGYFLNQDGTVRWSDVGFTGISHGAQSAICFGTELRLYRAVARSGPRDNTCGTGEATGPYDAANPPFDPNCPTAHIASWIDAPLVTPVDRLFAFVGMQDGQYGDDMFTMQRMNWVGMPVEITVVAAPYDGSHRYYASGVGHYDFLAAPMGFESALDIAFGVLPEDMSPTF